MMPNPSELITTIGQSPLHIFFDGAAAVNLFFVLSGFCIALPYVKEGSKQKIQYFQFITKRIFRLYPAYWIALIIAYIIKIEYNSPSEIFLSEWGRSFFNWSNLSIYEVGKIISLVSKFDTNILLPPSWSLVYEMRMAFLLPLFIFLVKNYNKYDVLIYITSLVISLFFPLAGVGLFALLFFLGIIVANNINNIYIYINKINIIKYRCFCLLGFALYTSRFPWQNIFFSSNTPLVDWLFNLTNSLGSIILISCFFRSGIIDFFSGKYSVFLGEISYSLYLTHFPILLLIFSLKIPLFITIIGAGIITVIISFLIYKKIEDPGIRIGRILINRYL